VKPEDNCSRNRKFRVGVDIGGTFTDVAFISNEGEIIRSKVPSTPGNYNDGITRGIQEILLNNRLEGNSIDEVVHGCTVATNAILEHTGAKTGLITTKGFRDVLEIRRYRMPELYNLRWNKPEPLCPRELRMEVDERINCSGQVVRPLDLEQAKQVIDTLVAKGVESIAICLLNSYANPEHEQDIKHLITTLYPNLYISASSDIVPVIKEYERTSEAVVNAYIKPSVAKYMLAMRTTLIDIGVKAPLLIMQSSGGMMSVNLSIEKPIYIIECGPAAGVVGSCDISSKLQTPNIITLDMGGTTTKASLIEDGKINMAQAYEVGSGISMASRLTSGGGYVVRVPSIDIAEIGSGGGSQLWVDIGGIIHAGPRSSGAVPGPACYGLGGTEPTQTDANLVLGYLPNELAGNVKLDKELAVAAIQNKVSEPLDIDVTEAAWGAFMISNSNMLRAIRAVSTLRGRDPRNFSLMAYGGAGPIHAVALARELEIKEVIIPPAAGVFSSFGLLFAGIEHHSNRSFFRRLDQSIIHDVNAVWSEMLDDVMIEITAAHYPDDMRVTIHRAMDARYSGQSSELTIDVPWDTFEVGHVPDIIGSFNAEHLNTYAHNRPDETIDVVSIRLSAKVELPRQMKYEKYLSLNTDLTTVHDSSYRQAYFGPEYGWMETPVISSSRIAGEVIEGPVIIELYDATCVVPPYASVESGDWGSIRIKICD